MAFSSWPNVESGGGSRQEGDGAEGREGKGEGGAGDGDGAWESADGDRVAVLVVVGEAAGVEHRLGFRRQGTARGKGDLEADAGVVRVAQDGAPRTALIERRTVYTGPVRGIHFVIRTADAPAEQRLRPSDWPHMREGRPERRVEVVHDAP